MQDFLDLYGLCGFLRFWASRALCCTGVLPPLIVKGVPELDMGSRILSRPFREASTLHGCQGAEARVCHLELADRGSFG